MGRSAEWGGARVAAGVASCTGTDICVLRECVVGKIGIGFVEEASTGLAAKRFVGLFVVVDNGFILCFVLPFFFTGGVGFVEGLSVGVRTLEFKCSPPAAVKAKSASSTMP